MRNICILLLIIFSIMPEHSAAQKFTKIIKSNEKSALKALRLYSAAQQTYQETDCSSANGTEGGQFCPGFQFLGGKNAHKGKDGKKLKLLPDAVAQATSVKKAYKDYYFINTSAEEDDPAFSFGLFAVPARYGKTGIHVYHINSNMCILRKDMKGALPTKGPDSSWNDPFRRKLDTDKLPALLRSELGVIIALHQYSYAQLQFKKGAFGGANELNDAKQYCPNFSKLGGTNAFVDGDGKKLTLLPDAFVMATTPDKAYKGYYFMNPPKGFVNNWTDEYGLFAVPGEYGKTGKRCYYLDDANRIWMKDLKGASPGKLQTLDETWRKPSISVNREGKAWVLTKKIQWPDSE